MENIKKIVFADDFATELVKPDVNYSCVYAPNAKIINVAGADKVFCSPDATVLAPGAQVLRADWYLENECVRNRNISVFKYKILPRPTFNKSAKQMEKENFDIKHRRPSPSGLMSAQRAESLFKEWKLTQLKEISR